MKRADIVGLDKAHVWHPYTAMEAYIAETDPLVVVRSEGAYLHDADGTRYLDANGSWWVSTLGHRHPRLMRALAEQAAALPHVSLAGITHEPAALLASELAAIAPGSDRPGLPASERLSRVFYSDNGSTAVEVAIKMAAQYWAQNGQPRRTRFITLSGAFHGETMGATSVGAFPCSGRSSARCSSTWCTSPLRRRRGLGARLRAGPVHPAGAPGGDCGRHFGAGAAGRGGHGDVLARLRPGGT